MTEPIRFKVPGPELEKYLARVDHAPTGPFAVTAADLIAALNQNDGLRREVLIGIGGGERWASGEVDQLRRVVAGLEGSAEVLARELQSAEKAYRDTRTRAEQAEAESRTAARDAAHHISRRVSVNFLDGCDPLSAESVALAVDRQHRAWVDLSNKLAAIRRTLDE